MEGLWAAVVGVIAVTGTILGVVLTQQSERSRQVAEVRQREVELELAIDG